MKSDKKSAGKRFHNERLHWHEKPVNVSGPFAFAKNREGHEVVKNKHLLKKKIVKMLRKQGQLSIDELIFKLDVEPSRLFKAVLKLQREGMILQERKKHHHTTKSFESGTGEKEKQQKRQRLAKVCGKMARHGGHKDTHGFRGVFGGHR